MTPLDIAHLRLYNQRISQQKLETPAEVVAWLGAVQAQDNAGGKWAIAQRMTSGTDTALNQALNDGTILRTHVMRPTWHYVTPADIRWMLTLTAPRVHALSAYYYRQLELDDALFARSDNILFKALEGGKHMTRPELTTALQEGGIDAVDMRVVYIIAHAELEGIVCSGAWRGKQATYALLAERAPQAKTLTRDESLATLAQRYFTSHGPATLKDYVWWSGLTTEDAKAGLEMIKGQLEQMVVDGQTYWFSETISTPRDEFSTVYLLPNYDEYIVGYTDRSAIYDPQHNGKLDARGNVLFNHIIVLDSQIVGIWKRSFKKSGVVIEPTFFRALNDVERLAFADAANHYGMFHNLPASF